MLRTKKPLPLIAIEKKPALAMKQLMLVGAAPGDHRPPVDAKWFRRLESPPVLLRSLSPIQIPMLAYSSENLGSQFLTRNRDLLITLLCRTSD
jgi:hypothetical protein